MMVSVFFSKLASNSVTPETSWRAEQECSVKIQCILGAFQVSQQAERANGSIDCHLTAMTAKNSDLGIGITSQLQWL